VGEDLFGDLGMLDTGDDPNRPDTGQASVDDDDSPANGR
jgi:hypothetical protein